MKNIIDEKKELLRSEWEHYIHHDIASEKTKEIILQSWERCQKYNVPADNDYPLSVLSAKALTEEKKKSKELIRISAPIRRVIEGFIRGSHFIIALTNADGVIIEISGDQRMKESVVGGGFIEGADWSEKSVGSNAIGTAIAINEPIQFAGYEHFCTFTQKTACAAAPIHDPDGQIIGTIDLTGRLRDVTHHTLGIVVAMASDIENAIRISRAERKSRLDNAYKEIMLEAMTQGVVALNDKNCITHMNKSAISILQLERNYTGESILPFMRRQEMSVQQLLSGTKTWTDREISLRFGNKQIRVTGTLRNIIDDSGQRLGSIFIFDAIRRTQQIASRYAGATARLTFDDIIGESSIFKNDILLAQAAAKSDASILLLGESGTGKDIMAQAIHNASKRKDNPYVAINCGAIPKELIASELFGYIDGAFTGARRGGSAGKFEMADGGTIFLDEIGEMPLDLQVHLLRVLENRMITRVGAAQSIPIDVRIIAATNANLKQAVDAGLFRSDLYYRLNVISLDLPPLRERREDIPLLIRHFYKQYCGNAAPVPQDYEQLLCRYNWPGNIRELRNVIERTVSLSPKRHLSTAYLPMEIINFQPPEKKETISSLTDIAAGITVSDLEKEALIAALSENNGNISKTAAQLGVARTTVYRKIKQYHIET